MDSHKEFFEELLLNFHFLQFAARKKHNGKRSGGGGRVGGESNPTEFVVLGKNGAFLIAGSQKKENPVPHLLYENERRNVERGNAVVRGIC